MTTPVTTPSESHHSTFLEGELPTAESNADAANIDPGSSGHSIVSAAKTAGQSSYGDMGNNDPIDTRADSHDEDVESPNSAPSIRNPSQDWKGHIAQIPLDDRGSGGTYPGPPRRSGPYDDGSKDQTGSKTPPIITDIKNTGGEGW